MASAGWDASDQGWQHGKWKGGNRNWTADGNGWGKSSQTQSGNGWSAKGEGKPKGKDNDQKENTKDWEPKGHCQPRRGVEQTCPSWTNHAKDPQNEQSSLDQHPIMEKTLSAIGETGPVMEEVRRLFPQLNHQLLTFNEMRKELLKQMPGRPMDEKVVEWMVYFLGTQLFTTTRGSFHWDASRFHEPAPSNNYSK